MNNYARNIKILSIVFLVIGILRTIVVIPELSSYGELRVLGMPVYLAILASDLLTSVGAVILSVACLVAGLKDKALLPLGILSIIMCVIFFASYIAIAFLADVPIMRGTAVLVCALPAMMGVNMIQRNSELKKAAASTPWVMD